MVNVYILTNSVSDLSGWTEISSSYRDKLILLGGTPLSTGGTSTHTHSASGNTSEYHIVSSRNIYPDGSGNGIYTLGASGDGPHSHRHDSGSVTITAANHVPSYKTFRVFYRNINGWNGKVPAGAIVFSTSAISGWSWVDDGLSYFIMISATAGTTGGSTYHSHAMSASLNNYTSYSLGVSSIQSGFYITSSTHGHDAASFNSSNSNVYDYYKLGFGLVTNSVEDSVRMNFRLLFDGDPGSGWEADANTERFLGRSSDGTLTTSGSYVTLTHSHGGSWSANSSSSNACFNGSAAAYYYSVAPLCSHVHSMSGTIGNADATPAYVRLLLYKANRNFGMARTCFFITC